MPLTLRRCGQEEGNTARLSQDRSVFPQRQQEFPSVRLELSPSKSPHHTTVSTWCPQEHPVPFLMATRLDGRKFVV